jgi:hypothetical protein
MPAVSKAQREAIAIAEHHPDELYARNRGLLKMSQGQLHDFAATPQKGLPGHVPQQSNPVRDETMRQMRARFK